MSDLIILAGTPPTTLLSGTSADTTAPAATTAFSPIVTPGKIVAPAPIYVFFLINTLLGTRVFLSAGGTGWFSDVIWNLKELTHCFYSGSVFLFL